MKYVTPYQYAKLCGLTRQAIYNRIKKGTIEVSLITDPTGFVGRYIDVDAFPPGRKEPAGGRPRKKS